MSNPFVGYSVKEIEEIEASTYVIQVGSDLFHDNGRYTFSHRSAVYFHNKILNNLVNLIESGTAEQRDIALKCLAWLKILPLRMN
jgi:hypothetical protein